MTTITLPRATVEQALEALESCQDCDYTTGYVLRQSFDEQAVSAAIVALWAALAQQAEPVEPVAKVELMTTGGNAGLATRIVEIDDHFRDRLRPGQLLYTAPPKAEPPVDPAEYDDAGAAERYNRGLK